MIPTGADAVVEGGSLFRGHALAIGTRFTTAAAAIATDLDNTASLPNHGKIAGACPRNREPPSTTASAP